MVYGRVRRKKHGRLWTFLAMRHALDQADGEELGDADATKTTSCQSRDWQSQVSESEQGWKLAFGADLGRHHFLHPLLREV